MGAEPSGLNEDLPAAVDRSQLPAGPWTRRRRPDGTLVVTGNGCELITKLASLGSTDLAISKALRCDPKTLARVLERQEEVREALDYGRARLEDELVHRCLAWSRKGCRASTFFLLKTRCGLREVGQQPTSITAQQNVQINLGAPMTDEQFNELLERSGLRPLPEAAEGGDQA